MSAARWLAIALIAVGLVLGLGAGWQWFGKVRHVAAEQRRLDQALTTRWAGAAGTAAAANPARPAFGRRRAAAAVMPVGTPIARLHLPTIARTLVVVEGAADKQLDQGPGRMANTPPLGAPGNTALAGHRYPGLFWNLDQIEVGDPIVVETADEWLVYHAVRTVIVEPADQTVLAAPPAATPTMLTLITCEPKLSTSHRLVKQAALVRSDRRDGPAPKELQAEPHR